MLKLLGGLLIFGGGGMVWWTLLAERRRKQEILLDLFHGLRRMGEEIRMVRTPLPVLLNACGSDCRRNETAELFIRTASAARRGEGLREAWRDLVDQLPLERRIREPLLALGWMGDEACLCKEIHLVTHELSKQMEYLEQKRPEETKRVTALCFSAAALLVILLI